MPPGPRGAQGGGAHAPRPKRGPKGGGAHAPRTIYMGGAHAPRVLDQPPSTLAAAPCRPPSCHRDLAIVVRCLIPVCVDTSEVLHLEH